jgi:carbamoyltransferase
MLYLGISEDLFDAGVALCDDENVLFASNEERYTRRKNEGGFPRLALKSLFDYTGVNPRDIDAVFLSGVMTPPVIVRAIPQIHYWIFNALRQRKETLSKRLVNFAMFSTPISHSSQESKARVIARAMLPMFARWELGEELGRKPLSFVDHHRAHAAAAWSLSGFPETLCITADGMGDGLSITVSRCGEKNGITRLWTAPSRSSFGLFFEMLTEAFGFVSCRDEGKVTGLAAHGDLKRIQLPNPFEFHGPDLVYKGLYGSQGVEWTKRELLSKHSREDISAWAQDILETTIAEIARRWTRETGVRRLAVAGGVFANVKLNQRLHELDDVEELFVCPNMGDGGLSLGAIRAERPAQTSLVKDVFLGEDYQENAIESVLKTEGLSYERMETPERAIAELLSKGRIVARFHGRMEWGPRALGNRSILAPATDKSIPDRLNSLLSRSDFMPFAPALASEDAEEWVLDSDAARHAAEFMTVCFKCSDRMKNEHPAVVHVDGTARAQFVSKTNNPTFHAILNTFKELTGSSVVLNTSFNIHEEPIVRTPLEAVTAYKRAKLDFLAIGPFLARGENSPK